MDKRSFAAILSSPFSPERWNDALISLFGVKRLLKQPKTIMQRLSEDDKEKAKDAFELGSFDTADDRIIGLYHVKLQPGVWLERNRVGLRGLLRSVYHDVDGALIVFEQGDKWRLTFVSEIRTLNDSGHLVQENTEPRRYTYLLGKGEVVRTATERFLLLAGKAANLRDIKEAFSVEKLNDEFFRAYYDHYRRFTVYLANKRNGYRELFLDHSAATEEAQEKPIRDFVKLLLGRIVFLHFLQKKGWLGCPNGEQDWHDGPPAFMQALYASYPDKTHFHSGCLRELFFKTLNRKRAGDLFAIPIAKAPGERPQKVRVPYLNGGLFDDDVSARNDIDFPAEYFAELFGFFEQYNFTVDENDPFEAEVGIDPEMLGHIFENLLEENRNKGVYYTPKEIVHYMCTQSLSRYLRTHLPECTDDDAPATIRLQEFLRSYRIDKLLDRSDYIVKNAARISGLLERIKVCDPAIGSGAFPMGMLQQIFNIRTALDLTLNSSDVKRSIIQQAIYGVDIDPGSVDIARLRFWLALLVDEDAPTPLPNLDYKIMQGNSLLESFEGIDLQVLAGKEAPEETKVQTDLFGRVQPKQMQLTTVVKGDRVTKIKQLIHDYFSLDEPVAKKAARKAINEQVHLFIDDTLNFRRLQLKLRANELRAKRIRDTKQEKALAGLNEQLEHLEEIVHRLESFLDKEERPFFLWHTYFADAFVGGGFDVVIGNPPYLRIQGIQKDDPAFAARIKTLFKAATGSFDLYAIFVEMGLSLLKPKGVLAYIMPVKWTNAAFGEGLRKVISEGEWASQIISFEAYQVFNVSTYTGLQWFQKGGKALRYYGLDKDIKDNDELGGFLNSLSAKDFNPIPHSRLTETPWTLTGGAAGDLLLKMLKQEETVSTIFERFFTGLQTSKDSVYFIMDCEVSMDKQTITGYSKELDEEVEIEKGLVKPLLKGDQVHRYEAIRTRNYVIFPYRLNGSKPELYTERELKHQFPFGYKYLKRNEAILRDRESGKLGEDTFWFRYIYPKNLMLFAQPKLFGPDISLGGNYAFDKRGEFYSTTTLYGYVKFPEVAYSYEFLMAQLNSRICWYFLRNTGTVLANGYFRYKPDYLNPFPIAAASMAEQQTIEALVGKITTLKKDKKDTTRWEAKIDALIFHLYYFTQEEMNAVLASLPEVGLAEKNAIQNEYWAIANKRFKLEV